MSITMRVWICWLQINLESGTRQQTAVNVLSPDRECFAAAQRRIHALMERDSYRRFIESDAYRQHLATAAAAARRPNTQPPHTA